MQSLFHDEQSTLGSTMQAMHSSSNLGVPYAFVVVPVMHVVSMPCDGTGYVQPQPGHYLQYPSNLTTYHPTSAASSHDSSATHLRGADSCRQREQPVSQHRQADNGVADMRNQHQASQKKSMPKLSNKKIALPHAKRVAQITARKFQEQVFRLALFGCHTTSAEAALDKAALRTGTLIADFSSEVSTALVDPEQADVASITSGSFLTETTQSALMERVQRTSLERTETNLTQQTQSSLTERTESVFSMTSACASSTSSTSEQGFAFITSTASWESPRVMQGRGKVPRIGIDLGGVVFTTNSQQLVLKAVQGVRQIVDIFGPGNVFIVSKVKLGRGMHNACAHELSKPGGFLEQVKIPRTNVVFVSCIKGTYGKGAVCAKLGLTHFVDDRFDVLEAAFEDADGNNSGEHISRMNGKLFHFEHGGHGKHRPKRPRGMSAGVAAHYHAVSGWVELLADFGVDIADPKAMLPAEPVHHVATTFVARRVHDHRIVVSTDESLAFRAIDALKDGFGEIEDFSGVKITLRGKGSPDPQPPRFEQEPLEIVIRSKAEADDGAAAMNSAIPDVEALLVNTLRLVG